MCLQPAYTGIEKKKLTTNGNWSKCSQNNESIRFMRTNVFGKLKQFQPQNQVMPTWRGLPLTLTEKTSTRQVLPSTTLHSKRSQPRSRSWPRRWPLHHLQAAAGCRIDACGMGVLEDVRSEEVGRALWRNF